MTAIETIEKRQLRKGLPRFKAGDTVRVHFRVIEGSRSRVQVFEGIVIKRQGAGVRETFTVRKQSFGVGVERTFPLHSPKIEKIEVVQIGDVSRAKLYYLREKVGKKARVRAKQYGGKVLSADVDEAAEEAPEEAPEAEAEVVEEPVAEQPEASADEQPEPDAEPEPEAARRRRGGRARDFLASTGSIGARYVVGADEAGRGSLAGPLLVAGVLLDYDALRGSKVRPLALLNDSKQLTHAQREELFHAVVGCAERISVQAFSPARIDRDGLHVCNLRGLRAVPPCADAARRGLPRRRLPARPRGAGAHGRRRRRRAQRRDRRRLDRRQGRPRPADAPHGQPLSRPTASPRTSGTSRPSTRRACACHGPSDVHRRSFQALCYAV